MLGRMAGSYQRVSLCIAATVIYRNVIIREARSRPRGAGNQMDAYPLKRNGSLGSRQNVQSKCTSLFGCLADKEERVLYLPINNQS